MVRKASVRKTTIQKRDDYIHIETDGCIVNIYPGEDGGKRTVVSVLCDGDRFSDGHKWGIESVPVSPNKESADIRIVRIDKV